MDDKNAIENNGTTPLPKYKSILFPEVIENESAIEFLNAVEDALQNGNNVHIFVDTDGGEWDITKHITLTLNIYYEIYPQNIVLFTGSRVFSGGMDFLRDTNIPCLVSDLSVGLLHLPATTLFSRTMHTKHSLSSVMHSMIEKNNKEYIDKWKKCIELTDYEISILLDGQDLYIKPERMKKYFNSVTVSETKKEKEENVGD